MQIPIHPCGLGLLPGLLEEIELPQRFLLGLHGDSFVIAGGVNRDMAQPVLNHGQTDTGGKQVAGRGAAPPMNRMYFFLFDGRRFAGCRSQVLAAEVVKAGARQASTPLIDKEEVSVGSQSNPPLRFQIGAQEGRGAIKQRNRALLSPFAVKKDLFLVEIEIRNADSAQLRSPCAGVIQGAQDAQIPVAVRTPSVDGSKNRIDFVLV